MENAFSRAAGHPLVRGGLALMVGVIVGSAIGAFRVALTAYFLGTHSQADSLAVALGPLDSFNSILVNSVLFAFVPMLTARVGADRLALFCQLRRGLMRVFCVLTVGVFACAPWLMRVLAPGLAEPYLGQSVEILRILAFSMPLAGIASLYSALLFTHNRFAPTAFYQAALNVCTVVSAIAFWKWLGVYAFAAGYAAGAAAQLAVVASAARRHVRLAPRVADDLGWRELLAKPAYFAIYAAGLALNVAFTRAWATHAGAGMAAALDYCMRGVGFPLALLVNPITNSLLPEIARLRNVQRFRDALRLIDRSLGIAALIVIAGTVFALAFRTPAIALFFQHGNFTPGSTQLVAAVFLGLGPSLAGWTLLEVAARSLFALDRPWLPVLAAAIPITVNVAITFGLHSHRPELIGAGASAGVTAAFVAVFVAMHARRGRWAAAA